MERKSNITFMTKRKKEKNYGIEISYFCVKIAYSWFCAWSPIFSKQKLAF